MKGRKIRLKEWHRSLIKINIAFLQAFIVFFIGLLISFVIFYSGYDNPIFNKVGIIDPEVLEAELIRIGYYDPLSVKFQKYFINFLSGNWGKSYILQYEMPVTDLMRHSVPDTIEIMLLPLILGLGGIKLGKFWVKKKRKIYSKILNLFITLGVALPLIFLAPMIQYIFGVSLPNLTFGRLDLPVMFRRSPGLPAPPNITGFALFDSILSREWVLVNDYILHSILPWFLLSLAIIPLFLKQTRIEIESDSRKNSIVSNSFIAGKMFGLLFLFTIVIELTFNLTGFGYWFMASILTGDPFVINGFIFMIIIFFTFTILLANLIPIATKFLKRKVFKGETHTIAIEADRESEQKERKKENFKGELKSYILSSLKNPFTIIGISLILILVIVSVVHPILRTYPLDKITFPYIPLGDLPFSPPSSGHPLGTTIYGYDVLSRVLYGTREAFTFGIIVVLIGLAGGSIFGFLAGRFHRYVHSGIIGPMIIFFLFPGLLLAILIPLFFGFNYLTIMLLFGILLIPIFTRIIANAIRRENNYLEITKAIIKYIPLEMAFAIILYQGLGFIGFSSSQIPQLGETLEWGRTHFFSAPWAMFWPGFFIFLIILGLIFLHEGLQAPSSSGILSEEPSSRFSEKIKSKVKKRKSVQDTLIEQSLEKKSELDTLMDESQNSKN